MPWVSRLGIACLMVLNIRAATVSADSWTDFKAKRQQLEAAHQEFGVKQTIKSAPSTQASERRLILDMAGGKWREASVTGSGKFIKIFDGSAVLSMEEGGEEFVRSKKAGKDDDPEPAPYVSAGVDWSKLAKREERPCGFSTMTHGSTLLLIDLTTGLVISRRTVELIETPRLTYQRDVTLALERMQLGTAADPALFTLNSDTLKEVKELSRWSAAKIKKQLVGKPAPELNLVDIEGKPVELSAFKGKTVLLDFWTTWCLPCRHDAPALDKLYARYSGQNLMIIGISVSEERPIVEKFLKEHPHPFPIALTTENEMPRPYQIGAFPTYMIVDPDGTLSAAVEGDQGFGELRKLLKKAGLEVD